MAVKNYVLDTNVLLHDARSLYAFADNNVVIPIFVIEEIDTFKKDQKRPTTRAPPPAQIPATRRWRGARSSTMIFPRRASRIS